MSRGGGGEGVPTAGTASAGQRTTGSRTVKADPCPSAERKWMRPPAAQIIEKECFSHAWTGIDRTMQLDNLADDGESQTAAAALLQLAGTDLLVRLRECPRPRRSAPRRVACAAPGHVSLTLNSLPMFASAIPTPLSLRSARRENGSKADNRKRTEPSAAVSARPQDGFCPRAPPCRGAASASTAG
jgi:hypothetical protein